MDRRELLRVAGIASAGVLLPQVSAAAVVMQQHAGSKEQEPEVTATEDLMREHGVLRRALLVYAELVPRLREKRTLDAAALNRAAKLFHQFGEVYHEEMLEEQHIFPIVRKMTGRAAKYPDILVGQHQRGREITDYILATTAKGSIASANAEPLARALETMVRMYENHAAREDTIVFPAWKTNFSNKQLDEIGDQFEDIEHKMFGKDGFDDAESQISQIEQAFGLSDLSQFTAPPPPK
ncbi:MAG TPA: hemerythrin domain-containing protein [Terriglobales bacterium]|jgi:hemerythrin-like domain-containing protein